MSNKNNMFRILVVEDSKTQAHLLGNILEHEGYTLILATDAAAALEIIRSEPPSLVVTDILMPGISGYRLCEEIRRDQVTADIPVILLTSLTSPRDIILSLQCGADDFISKPYDRGFLINKIDKILNRAARSSELKENPAEDVVYSGEHYQINVGRQRMLDLMISAYEAAIQKNSELLESQVKLVDLNRRLEVSAVEKQKAFDDVHQKEELLLKWNMELNIINRIGRVINQSGSLEELFPAIANEFINAGFPGKRYGVEFWLKDSDGRLLKKYECFKKDEPGIIYKNDNHNLRLPSIAGNEQIFIISECGDQELIHCENCHGNQHGHVFILLKAREKVTGLINLITETGEVYEKHIQEMLLSIGEQLGMAIESHNLFMETKRLSLHDPLTGLANRRMIEIKLGTEISRAKRYGTLFSLVMMDIDFFKQYNDNHGHDEGDRILVELGSYLKENVRDTDLAARYGGEEFVLILAEAGLKETYLIAERHQAAIRKAVGITVSMGITEYKANQTSEEIIKKADEALYLAKENGRNRVEVGE